MNCWERIKAWMILRAATRRLTRGLRLLRLWNGMARQATKELNLSRTRIPAALTGVEMEPMTLRESKGEWMQETMNDLLLETTDIETVLANTLKPGTESNRALTEWARRKATAKRPGARSTSRS